MIGYGFEWQVMIGNVNTTFELLCDHPWVIMISYNSVNDKKKKEAGPLKLTLISMAYLQNNATQNTRSQNKTKRNTMQNRNHKKNNKIKQYTKHKTKQQNTI